MTSRFCLNVPTKFLRSVRSLRSRPLMLLMLLLLLLLLLFPLSMPEGKKEEASKLKRSLFPRSPRLKLLLVRNRRGLGS